MFDEEVQFIHHRKPPKSSVLDYSLFFTGVGLSGGATFASFALAHKVLDLSKGWSALAGLATGLTAGIVLAVTAAGIAYEIRNGMFRKKQQELDVHAIGGEAKIARFEYRGNQLDCVLRPDYTQDGHIFYMSINDGIIQKPTFSYQPQREEQLKFRFLRRALSDKELKFLSDKHLFGEPNSSAEDIDLEYILSLQYLKSFEANDRSKILIAKLDTIVAKYANEMKGSEKLVCNYGESEQSFETTLIYSGRNYFNRLPQFSRCASQLMQTTYSPFE